MILHYIRPMLTTNWSYHSSLAIEFMCMEMLIRYLSFFSISFFFSYCASPEISCIHNVDLTMTLRKLFFHSAPAPGNPCFLLHILVYLYTPGLFHRYPQQRLIVYFWKNAFSDEFYHN